MRFWSLGDVTVGVGEDGDVTVGDVEAEISVKMGSTAGIELHSGGPVTRFANEVMYICLSVCLYVKTDVVI